MQETGRTASARPLAAVPSEQPAPAATAAAPPLSFDRFYYKHDCGDYPYARSPEWLAMFEILADRIVEELNPTTLLDAGCAMGLLVETLRARGVDAWGMDVSEYAIDSVEPGTGPFCRVGSLTGDLPEGLPDRFDLVTCIEVVEHIPRENMRRAIERLSSLSDRVLFSSEPNDYAEPTHINVQPEEEWSALFASFGMFRKLEVDPTFLTPWTVIYERQSDRLPDVVRRYDRAFLRARTEVRQLRETALRHQNRLSALEATDLGALADERDALKAHVAALDAEIEESRRLLSTRTGRAVRAWHAARNVFGSRGRDTR